MRRLAKVGIALAGLGFAGAWYISVVRLVIVHDETGEVVSAVVTNDRSEQALWRLPFGLFVAVPGMEGIVEVRCRNGARTRWGYVTSYMDTSVRVVGEVPCARMLDG